MPQPSPPDDRRRPTITVGAAQLLDGGTPVVAGCCFAPGSLGPGQPLSCEDPQGEVSAAFARPLQLWPDGSVRWAAVSFLARRRGLHAVVPAAFGSGGAGLPSRPVYLKLDREPTDEADLPEPGGCDPPAEAARSATIDNGIVRLQVQAGRGGPIARLEVDGHPWVRSPQDFQLLADDASSLHADAGWVRVLDASPLRVRLRVYGQYATPGGDRRLDYRLDIELWAGQSSVRLDHLFINRQPGEELTLSSLGIAMNLDAGSASPATVLRQLHHGLFATPRLVKTARPVVVQADAKLKFPYVTDPAMLEDTQPLPRYLEPGRTRTEDWVGVEGASGRALVHLHDMAAMHPKQVRVEAGRIDVALWPAAAGALRLPQGRARRHSLMIGIDRSAGQGGSGAEAGAIRDLVTAPLHEGRALVDPAWVRSCGECDAALLLRPGQHYRMEHRLRQLTAVPLADGLMDLGDAPDPWYEHVYLGVGQRPLRREAVEPANPLRRLDADTVEFAGDGRFEPIWTNNEYDLIHSLAQELIRTGRDEIWPKLLHATRHNIETDFVWFSDDPWQHHGSPAHSAYHNFASAYPSHLWTQGLLEVYRLTGDDDVLEVARALARTIVRNLDDEQRGPLLLGFNREIGWAALALVHVASFTGDAVVTQKLTDIVEYLMAYDRSAADQVIKLSASDPRDNIHRQIVNSFFGYASMVEAVDSFAKAFDRPDAHDWLRQFVRDLLPHIEACFAEGMEVHVRSMLPLALAIGHELTGDPQMLRLGMLILEQGIASEAPVQPTLNPGSPAWDPRLLAPKPAAMEQRGLSRFIARAHGAGLLERLEYRFR